MNSAVRTGWIALAALLFLVYSLLLVPKKEGNNPYHLPLLQAAGMRGAGETQFASHMATVGFDLWTYYHEIRFVLRGEMDDAFLHFKAQGNQSLPSLRTKGWRLPYRDISFEYPPLAFLFVLLPGLFAKDLYQYRILFSLFASVAFLLSLLLATRIGEKTMLNAQDGRPKKESVRNALLFALFLGPLTVYRLDIFAAFFVILACWALHKEKWVLSAIALSLGVATKLYPLLLFPLFLFQIGKAVSWKKSAVFAVAFFATLLAVFLPAILADPQGYWNSLTYHSERGVEIESTYAGFAELFRLMGSPAEVYSSFGSNNLAWPGETWVRDYWKYLALFLFGFIYLAYFLRVKKKSFSLLPDSEKTFLFFQAAFSLIFALLLTGKVFSPQYLLWLFPLFLFLTGRVSGLLPLFLQATLATQILYPYLYLRLLSLNPLPIFVLAWRNLLLLVLFLMLMISPFSRKPISEKAYHG